MDSKNKNIVLTLTFNIIFSTINLIVNYDKMLELQKFNKLFVVVLSLISVIVIYFFALIVLNLSFYFIYAALEKVLNFKDFFQYTTKCLMVMPIISLCNIFLVYFNLFDNKIYKLSFYSIPYFIFLVLLASVSNNLELKRLKKYIFLLVNLIILIVFTI
jgi:hypothetical protein